jgi:hypothetical protein
VVDCGSMGGTVEHDPSAPVLPDYSGANLVGIVPALLGGGPLPSWLPVPVQGASSVILVVLDGLGWNQLHERRDIAPTLTAMSGGAITSVVPSTTATALTSISTGLPPSEHGIVGYRVWVRGQVTNMLRWWSSDGDQRTSLPPAEMQPHRPFCGQRVPYVTSAELVGSAFSEAHLRGGRPIGYRAGSSLPVLAAQEAAGGEPFVHAYYAGIDRIAHERGFGPFYDAELRAADRLVADIIDRVGPDTAVLVTADHGQVEVGDRILAPSAGVLRCTQFQSGEGRMRWFHARPGSADELYVRLVEQFADIGWVKRRAEVIQEGWFGNDVPSPVAARLGDVVVAAREPVSLDDPDDSGPYDLVCRHGSLTPDEMLVPLIAARGVAPTSS